MGDRQVGGGMVRTPPLCTVLERTGDLTPAFQFLANGRPQFFPLLEFFILNDFSRPWKMPGGKNLDLTETCF